MKSRTNVSAILTGILGSDGPRRAVRTRIEGGADGVDHAAARCSQRILQAVAAHGHPDVRVVSMTAVPSLRAIADRCRSLSGPLHLHVNPLSVPTPDADIHALYPATTQTPRRITAAIEYLREGLATRLGST